MGKENEYRKHAASLLGFATRAANNDDKRRLVLMSEGWLNLADKVARLTGRREATERLVRQELFEQDCPKGE